MKMTCDRHQIAILNFIYVSIVNKCQRFHLSAVGIILDSINIVFISKQIIKYGTNGMYVGFQQ